MLLQCALRLVDGWASMHRFYIYDPDIYPLTTLNCYDRLDKMQAARLMVYCHKEGMPYRWFRTRRGQEIELISASPNDLFTVYD